MKARSEWNHRAIPDRVKERAATRWIRDGDCWISTYSTASHGYAQVGWQSDGDRAVVLAHRASWEKSMGPVPLGHTLDHLCKQKRCVNPEHLRVLPNFENARRTLGRDWPLGQCVNGHSNEHLEVFADGRRHCWICATTIWKSTPRLLGAPDKRQVKADRPHKPPRTHCRNGHDWNEENQYVRPNGRKECWPCKQATAKAWVLKTA